MNFEEEIRNYIIKEFQQNVNLSKFRDEDDLLDGSILDSFAILQIMTHLEEIYGIEIGNDEIVAENIGSIRKLADFVKRKRGNQ